MSAVPFPTPYAGAYYPIYNSGVKQYIVPTLDMPFDYVSALFIAFAHSYPAGGGAVLDTEQGQPDQPQRIQLLTQVARRVNPKILILISIGYGHSDWKYISDDLTSGTNHFPASVVAFIRKYGLDGFDIDDEDMSDIKQEPFNTVVRNLRKALDDAGAADGKTYYLTDTPAGGLVSADNMGNFNLINPQCYGGTSVDEIKKLGYPQNQISWGISTEVTPRYPTPEDYKPLAGIFNWSMSADSALGFTWTRKIGVDVGYHK